VFAEIPNPGRAHDVFINRIRMISPICRSSGHLDEAIAELRPYVANGLVTIFPAGWI